MDRWFGDNSRSKTHGLPDECTECQTGPSCPGAIEMLLLSKQFPDVLLSWQAASNVARYTVLRDPTAQGAGTTTVGQAAGQQLGWTDQDGLLGPPPMAFYLVRGVTTGGVSGP